MRAGHRRRARALAWLFLSSLSAFVAPSVAAGDPGAEAGGDATSAPADLVPWEREDLPAAGAPSEGNRPPTMTQAIGLALIHWYQRDLATRSVSRCPFAVSCSQYTARVIQRRGLATGVCQFIDRNLYRENAGMRFRYSLIERPDGSLKLDDGFFLDGGR